MVVKKVLIPAAGLASRLFPYSKSVNKLMLPVLNKPVVHYLVEELVKSGVEEVIISGRHLQAVKDYFKKDAVFFEMSKRIGKDRADEKLKMVPSCKIRFIKQHTPKGWVYELKRNRALLKKEPFGVVFSDILWHSDSPVFKQAVDVFSKTDMNVFTNGRFIFKPDVMDLASSMNFKLGDKDKGIERKFLRLVKDRGHSVLKPKGNFFDIGTTLEFLKTNTYFALTHQGFSKEYKNFLRSLHSRNYQVK